MARAATATDKNFTVFIDVSLPWLKSLMTRRTSAIGEALADAPSGATIRIAPGIYREVIRLQTPGVRLLGEGLAPQDVVIEASRSCGSPPCPPARQYYRDTTIIGAVDFIFGNALAYFERANIYGVQRPQVIVTAQSCERPDEVCGYVFRNSRIHADPSVRQIVLGRPWRALSTVSFVDSELDGRVIPAGFIDWNQENRLPTTRYLESGSRDPGAVPREQRQAFMLQPDAATLEPMASANRYLAGSDGWQAEIF